MIFSILSLIGGQALVGGAAQASSAPAGGRFVETSGRVLDTRSGTQVGAYNTPMPAGSWRSVAVTGKAGIPSSGVSAISATITTTGAGNAGYLNASPGGTTPSTDTTAHSFVAGQTESNSVILPVGSNGAVQFRSSVSVDLILDVQGYFTSTASGSNGFTAIAPFRGIDTRNGSGTTQGTLPNGGTRTLQFGSQFGVLANATAVAVVVTIANQSAGGYWKSHESNLGSQNARNYYRAGYAESFGATLSLDANGATQFGVYGSSADVIIDVVGFFGTSQSLGDYVPQAARVIDTRDGGSSAAIPSGGIAEVQVLGIDGLPDDEASAVQATLAAVNSSASGYLKVWADDQSEPDTSVLNFRANESTSNSMIVGMGNIGMVYVKNMGSAPVHLIVDVNGYFTGPVTTATGGSGAFKSISTLDGIEMLAEMSASSATQLANPVSLTPTLPSGASLAQDANGKVTISASSGSTLGEAFTQAVGANGEAVPSSVALQGATMVVTVSPQAAASAAYPVIVQVFSTTAPAAAETPVDKEPTSAEMSAANATGLKAGGCKTHQARQPYGLVYTYYAIEMNFRFCWNTGTNASSKIRNVEGLATCTDNVNNQTRNCIGPTNGSKIPVRYESVSSRSWATLYFWFQSRSCLVDKLDFGCSGWKWHKVAWRVYYGGGVKLHDRY